MAHAYCDDCGADVTVRDGRCLLDHPISGPVLPGRASRVRGGRGRTVGRRMRETARTSVAAPPSTVDVARPSPARPTGPFEATPEEVLSAADDAPQDDAPDGADAAAVSAPRPAPPTPLPPSLPSRSDPTHAAPPPDGMGDGRPSWTQRLARLPMLEMLGFSMPEQSVTILLPPPEQVAAHTAPTEPVAIPRRSPVGRIAAPTPRRPRPARPDPTTVDLRLTDVADASAPVPTDVLVERLWERTEHVPVVVDDLAPDTDAGVEHPSRRWGLTVAALVAVGIVAFVVSALLARPDQARRAEAARLAAVVEDARAVVSDGPPMVAVLTAVEPDSGALADATGWLARLDATARTLTAAPQRPSIAFAPDDLWDPFALIDEALAEQGRRLLGVGDDLAAALSYRLSILRAFDLPPLSVEANEARQAELATQLAEVRASSAALLAELPDHPAFTEHRRQADTLLAVFDGWQADYLTALREGDALEATRLTVSIRLQIDDLRAGLEGPLAAVRTSTLETLGEVDRALAEAAVLISRIR